MKYPDFVSGSGGDKVYLERIRFFAPEVQKTIELTDVHVYLVALEPRYVHLDIYGKNEFGKLQHYSYSFGDIEYLGIAVDYDSAKIFIDFLGENSELILFILTQCESLNVRQAFTVLTNLATKIRDPHKFFVALKLMFG